MTRSATSEAADWQNHHIEGYARAAAEQGLDSYFKAPLISHVEGNLWQGGCINGVRLPNDFKHVISLYPWERYKLGPKTSRVEYKAYDAAGEVNEAFYDAIVDEALAAVKDGKTLIHCQAGLNRSGYVAARVLMDLGHTVDEAITLLRETRSPMVLCNKDLEAHLHEIYERSGT